MTNVSASPEAPARRRRRLIGWAAAGALLALVGIGPRLLATGSQQGIATAARDALTRNGITADIVVDGADVALGGLSGQDVARATDLVRQISGVRNVTVFAPAAAPTTTPTATTGVPTSTTSSSTGLSTGSAGTSSPSTSTTNSGTANAPTRPAPGTALARIQFVLDSARLTPDSTAAIAQLAARLAADPTLRVRIAGHADDRGSPGPNLELSTLRATAVAEALRAAGVGAERVDVVGFGDTQPIGDNTTAAGRALNRRVDVTVV